MAGTAKTEVLQWEVTCPRMKNYKKAIMAVRMDGEQSGGASRQRLTLTTLVPIPGAVGSSGDVFKRGREVQVCTTYSKHTGNIGGEMKRAKRLKQVNSKKWKIIHQKKKSKVSVYEQKS